ncbi:MAG: malonyl-[acyl-carrier protein] O-methyltransferase BioC [Betaproteobacteria bacterium]|nr:MAG: malonyl-[acyl-carrier protein] O-methyltransferase BioC [Betaproteobacteria bacterium]
MSNLRAVQRSFDQAAAGYDAAAVLQREVATRLDEHLDLMRITPRRILDLGSGTGFAAPLLTRRFAKAERIALDLAPAMLCQERAARGLRERWLGPATRFVCADMHALPIAAASVDLIWSNLALQWADEPLAVFKECRRVLRPEGLFLFASFGPDTLHELRATFAQVDNHAHVNRFVDMHELGDALLATGFTAPVMVSERIVLTYADLKAMLQDLKAMGAHTVLAREQFGLMGRARWQALQAACQRFAQADGRLPATFEIVYGHAWAGAVQRPKSAANEVVIQWHGLSKPT